ncbi:MAG: hypothetical protein HYX42_07865 [Polaromonas sp.]|uniref:hypothetical protein n=1 Tax=Polaromonas sp. TaxID=1869339 RepID=UPI0025DA7954|nr:hypothetical protein [Polaromonas sp.]MBI2726151.1 hypothetical protein [Polaromonas sp.]
MSSFISQFLRLVLKLVLAAFGIVFALSLLAATLIFLVWRQLVGLFTGKKPPPLMAFGKFQRFSPQDIWAAGAGGSQAGKQGEVVDVEVREVRDDQRLR